MKKVLKYQLIDYKATFFWYFAVMTLISCVTALSITYSPYDHTYLSGIESSTLLVCFICGIVSFKEYYQLFAQNGISRRTYIKSSYCAMIIISGIFAVLNQLFTTLFQIVTTEFKNVNYSNLVNMIYESVTLSPMNLFVTNMIYTFVIGVFAFFAGYLIAVLFDLGNKIVKILIAAGIPIFLFVLIPIIFTVFQTFGKKVTYLFMTIFGVSTGNPYLGILTLAVMSAILAAVIYPVVKKVQIS